MKALVIGGTNGFGAALTEQFRHAGLKVITTGRSNIRPEPGHYVCDVADSEAWQKTVKRIAEDHPLLDMIVCVVGYARLKPSAQLNEQDWQQTEQMNFGYVLEAYKGLRKCLGLSYQRPKFVTIGSRWSYQTDCDELQPYIAAKHKLRAWTEELALLDPLLKANHYCVPTMSTPQYAEIVKSAANPAPVEVELADYQEVAKTLSWLLGRTEFSGQTYVIERSRNTFVLR